MNTLWFEKLKCQTYQMGEEKDWLNAKGLQTLMMNDGNIIVCTPDKQSYGGPKGTQDELNEWLNNGALDLPFETCWFDFLIEETDTIKSIGVHESEIGTYHFLILSEWSEDKTLGFRDVSLTQEDAEFYFRAKCLVYNLVNRLNSSIYQVGIEKTKLRIRIGRGKDRGLRKIKKLIHIAPKKESLRSPKLLDRTIDWSHQWEVRGHWRKIKLIGKDRRGDYTVKGFTWVVAHAKGAGEFIRKTRVLSQSQHQL